MECITSDGEILQNSTAVEIHFFLFSVFLGTAERCLCQYFIERILEY